MPHWSLVNIVTSRLTSVTRLLSFTMERENASILLTVVLVLAVLLLFLFLHLSRISENAPPGPHGFPLVGCMFYLGTSPHLDLRKLSQLYGNVFSIRLGCRNVVVLNSHSVVKEAFSKKASQFSGRPPLHSFQISSNGGKSIAFGDYGPSHLRYKKLGFRALHAVFSDVDRLNHIAQDETERLCTRLSTDTSNPLDLTACLKSLVLNFSFRLVFGDTMRDEDTKELERLMQAASDFIQNNPAVNVLDFFPWLHFIFHKECSSIKTSIKDLMHFMNKVYKRQTHADTIEVGVNVAAMLDKIIQEENSHTNGLKDRLGGSEQEMHKNPAVHILADLFGAGLETVSTSLCWAFLLILTKPGLQHELHEELQREVGSNRLPTLHDRVRLPLLHATILEVLRKASVLPLGIPHCTTQDTTVAGFHVRKGTVVLANLWAVNHDPTFFHDPESFNPYRFLDEDGHLQNNRYAFALPFSTGGRRCMGAVLAKAEVFMFLACLLQRFHFELSMDEGPINVEGQFGLTLKPNPFKVYVYPKVASANNN